MYSSIGLFNKELANLRWFNASTSQTDYSYQKKDWYDWSGPESEYVYPIGCWQQELYDTIIGDSKTSSLYVLWEKTQKEALSRAENEIGVNCDEDSWHAPTAAAWQASWTAALVAVYLASSKPLPIDLQTQWKWFLQGRWPCEYVAKDDKERSRFVKIYSDGAPPEGLVELFERYPNTYYIV